MFFFDVYGSWELLDSIKILPRGQLTICRPEGPIPRTCFFPTFCWPFSRCPPFSNIAAHISAHLILFQWNLSIFQHISNIFQHISTPLYLKSMEWGGGAASGGDFSRKMTPENDPFLGGRSRPKARTEEFSDILPPPTHHAQGWNIPFGATPHSDNMYSDYVQYNERCVKRYTQPLYVRDVNVRWLIGN